MKLHQPRGIPSKKIALLRPKATARKARLLVHLKLIGSNFVPYKVKNKYPKLKRHKKPLYPEIQRQL
jgi:hypothetical protein